MIAWGLAEQFDYAGELDRAGKIEFLRGLDVFSMPATYREPKGLPVLGALACGVPFVGPAHGVFPELAEATGGGLLAKPNDPQALADALARLVSDARLREELGRRGHEAVHRDFTAARMAEETLEIFRRILAKH